MNVHKRVQIALVTLLGGVLSVFLWLVICHRQSQPVFHAKPLDYWLREYARATPHMNEARRAFRRLGERAIPYLVQVLEERDPWWEKPYFRTFPYLPRFLANRLPKPICLAEIRRSA